MVVLEIIISCGADIQNRRTGVVRNLGTKVLSKSCYSHFCDDSWRVENPTEDKTELLTGHGKEVQNSALLKLPMV